MAKCRSTSVAKKITLRLTSNCKTKRQKGRKRKIQKGRKRKIQKDKKDKINKKITLTLTSEQVSNEVDGKGKDDS